MPYKLGDNIQKGNKVLIESKWHKITSKLEKKVITDKGIELQYGDEINGWRNK